MQQQQQQQSKCHFQRAPDCCLFVPNADGARAALNNGRRYVPSTQIITWWWGSSSSFLFTLLLFCSVLYNPLMKLACCRRRRQKIFFFFFFFLVFVFDSSSSSTLSSSSSLLLVQCICGPSTSAGGLYHYGAVHPQWHQHTLGTDFHRDLHFVFLLQNLSKRTESCKVPWCYSTHPSRRRPSSLTWLIFFL